MKLITFLMIMLSSVLVIAGGNADTGKTLYATCLACHGQNGEGNQALNSPALAGQEEWYVIAQLKSYKAGTRGTQPNDTFGAQMRPMAMTLADDQAIADVAAYIKTFSATKPATTISGDAAAGKTLYAACAACHGQNGEGNQALNSPRLDLQQDWYMVTQLKSFKDGLRGYDAADVPGSQMKPMAMTLADDAAINNVVAYITTLGK